MKVMLAFASPVLAAMQHNPELDNHFVMPQSKRKVAGFPLPRTSCHEDCNGLAGHLLSLCASQGRRPIELQRCSRGFQAEIGTEPPMSGIASEAGAVSPCSRCSRFSFTCRLCSPRMRKSPPAMKPRPGRLQGHLRLLLGSRITPLGVPIPKQNMKLIRTAQSGYVAAA